MKLSQSIKDRMKKLIVEAKFGELEKQNEGLFCKLADDIYNNFPGILKADKLPIGWLQKSSSLSCNFGGARIYLNMSQSRPMPYKLLKDRCDFDQEHHFTIRFHELTDQKSNIVERKKELCAELNGVLNGVNTDKQLLTIWPEAIQWLPSTPIPLPVVTSVDRLKTMLGDL